MILLTCLIMTCLNTLLEKTYQMQFSNTKHLLASFMGAGNTHHPANPDLQPLRTAYTYAK